MQHGCFSAGDSLCTRIIFSLPFIAARLRSAIHRASADLGLNADAISEKDLNAMMRDADKNHDGAIDFYEFLEALARCAQEKYREVEAM